MPASLCSLVDDFCLVANGRRTGSAANRDRGGTSAADFAEPDTRPGDAFPKAKAAPTSI